MHVITCVTTRGMNGKNRLGLLAATTMRNSLQTNVHITANHIRIKYTRINDSLSVAWLTILRLTQ